MEMDALCSVCGLVGSVQQIQEHFDRFHVFGTPEINTENLSTAHDGESLHESLKKNQDPNKNEVWMSSRCPTKHDVDATVFFLELRSTEKISNLFNNKKTLKQHVWFEIATEMNKAGFYVGDGRYGADKCRQKFNNLTKSYNNIMKHRKTTGVEKKDVPEYFDLMHKILSPMHKINPVYTFDALTEVDPLELNQHDTLENTQPEPSISPQPSTSTDHNLPIQVPINSLNDSQNNRITNKIKNKKSLKDSIIETIQTCHRETKEQNDQNLKVLHDLIKEGNDHKKAFLDLFRKLVDQKTKKSNRKRKYSSSDSE